MFATDLLAGLTELRGFSLERMLQSSRVTVRRKTGATVIVDDMEVPVWTTVATNVPFRLAGSDRNDNQSRTFTVGGVSTTVPVRTGNLPPRFALADDDHLDITWGENAGLVLRVLEAASKDQSTALRFPVEQVQRPEEWS